MLFYLCLIIANVPIVGYVRFLSCGLIVQVEFQATDFGTILHRNGAINVGIRTRDPLGSKSRALATAP